MKLTTTQETTLRKFASSVVSVGGVISAKTSVFLKGTLGTVIGLVTLGLMTASPETTSFGDFLGAIQSPALACMGLIGGLFWMFIDALLFAIRPVRVKLGTGTDNEKPQSCRQADK